MAHKPAKLTPTELEILKRTALGQSFGTIQKVYKLKRVEGQPLTREYFYVLCQRIRRKTGIVSTKDRQECDVWLKGMAPLFKHKAKHPTNQQIRAMRLRSQGLSNEEVGKQMGLHWMTVMNHCSVGCKRAGIPCHQGHDRNRQIRLWLAEYDKAEVETKAYLMAKPKHLSYYAPGEDPGLLSQIVEQHEAESDTTEKPVSTLTMEDF